MSKRPSVDTAEIDVLLSNLRIEVVAMAECDLVVGWGLSFPPVQAVGLHYVTAGSGFIQIKGEAPVALCAHSLVIVPADRAFGVWGANADTAPDPRLVTSAVPQNLLSLPHLQAGHGVAALHMICGYFNAGYGPSLNVFAAQKAVLKVQFDAADHLDAPLHRIVGEMRGKAVGMKAMTAALLDQVILHLLRRVYPLAVEMAQEVQILGDAPVARALADMLARPGAAHTLESLAATAGVSRSAFVLRFGRVVGRSPMATLREIRMQRAASLLADGGHSLTQVAIELGYASRSSFFRAFRTVPGVEPAAIGDTKAESER